MITVEVRGPQATVNGNLPEDLQQQLYLECSFPHARAIWRPDTLNKWDDGRIGVYYPRSGRIPTGCIPRLEHHLRTWSIPYEVDRPLPTPNHQFHKFPAMTYDDRAYQGQMLQAALSAPYCTLQAPARSGKTFVAACYIACRQLTPALFLVNTIDLCHQAREELSQWLGEPVGLIGDGIFEPAPVTVASIQTLHPALIRCGLAKPVKHDPTFSPERPVEKHLEAVDLLQSTPVRIVDEIHLAAAPTHQDVHRSMTSCAYSLGLSATPWVEGNNGIYLEASCGPVVLNISYSELIDEGKLVPPTIDIVKLPMTRYPKSVNYQTIYKEYITENDQRNGIIATWTRQQAEDGHSVIVFVNQINHGKHLADLCDGTFVHGGITGTDRQEIWNALRAKELPIVVSTVGKYGLDIPTLDACVMGAGGVATAPVLQAMTRVLTASKHKDHAHVLDFEDHARHLTEHSKQRIALYQTEQAFTINHREAEEFDDAT